MPFDPWEPVRRYWQSRRPLFFWALGFGALAALCFSEPSMASKEELAARLALHSRRWVDPASLSWEASGGTLTDLFCGRGLFFLAADAASESRDVYHAYVRVSPEGSPLSISRVRNLTETPLGNDVALYTHGTTALFTTLAFDAIQAVTLLDAGGIRSEDKPSGFLDRLLLAFSSFQKAGSFSGFGRVDLVFDLPPQKLALRLDSEQLNVDLGDPRKDLRYSLEQRVLSGVVEREPYAARALPQYHGPKPLVLWLVDTVRQEVGPFFIAWLERLVFGARDTLKRTTFSIFSSAQNTGLKAVAAVAPQPETAPSRQAYSWPPERVPSIWSEPRAEEGEWTAVSPGWLAPLPLRPAPGADEAGKAPPYFYKTTIRPDQRRPYVELLLVAMDMRQLELRMQAGYEDPRPLTGPPGTGRIPREAKVLERVVAAFNGAFKTTHGAYGMMVDDRVLVPPLPKAASIVVNASGDAGFGNWPASDDIPSDLRSFRQNLDPLVDDGVANPTGRSEWGEQLAGETVLTERTALCRTKTGQLYYAWGRELSGRSLGVGLEQAGCDYAVHLDMNQKHCGFVFASIHPGAARSSESDEIQYELLDREMDINPFRFVQWSPKDFFYLMVHDPRPPSKRGETWNVEAMAQPEPKFMPGIFRSELELGSLKVELLSIERGRVDYRIRAGRKEPNNPNLNAKISALTPDEYGNALIALNLGHTTASTEYGIAFRGRHSLPLRASYATLVASESGKLRLLPPDSPLELAEGEDAVQLPLLVQDGQLLPLARERGTRFYRGALCVEDSGRLLVASAEHDSSDALALALGEQGCGLVVALDRGSHHPLFVHKRGTDLPPLPEYETSVLFALDAPMEPHTYRFNHD